MENYFKYENVPAQSKCLYKMNAWQSWVIVCISLNAQNLISTVCRGHKAVKKEISNDITTSISNEKAQQILNELASDLVDINFILLIRKIISYKQ